MASCQNQNKVKALCIFPSRSRKQQLFYSQEYLNGNVEFFFTELDEGRISNYGAKSRRALDLQRVVEECCKMVRQHNISLIISTRDGADLIHAKLTEIFPHLRGPKLLSCFLACNKYYTRKLLDPDSFINYEFIEMEQGNVIVESQEYGKTMAVTKEEITARATEIISHCKVSFPIFCKPVLGSGNSYAKIVRTTEDVVDLLQKGHESLKSYSFLSNFFADNISSTEHKHASSNGYLLESFICASDVLMEVTVDGFVFDGDIYHWCLIDTFKWSAKTSSIRFWSIPSILSTKLQQQIWNKYDQIISRLISFGFNNQFVMIEIFVTKNERIKLIEVNTRMISAYYHMYKGCCSGDDICSALIKIGKGIKPELPVLTGRRGASCLLKSYEVGKKAEDVINFALCSDESNNVTLHVKEDTIIEDNGEGGFVLGLAVVFGSSLNEIKKANFSLHKKLYKRVEDFVQLEEKYDEITLL